MCVCALFVLFLGAPPHTFFDLLCQPRACASRTTPPPFVPSYPKQTHSLARTCVCVRACGGPCPFLARTAGLCSIAPALPHSRPLLVCSLKFYSSLSLSSLTLSDRSACSCAHTRDQNYFPSPFICDSRACVMMTFFLKTNDFVPTSAARGASPALSKA